MKLNSMTGIAIFFSILLLNINSAHAASACEVACDAAESVAEVACVFEIFGEPECSIAAAALAEACRVACASSGSMQVSDKSSKAEVKAFIRNTVKTSDLCNGTLAPKNKELADKFCDFHKKM